MEPSQPKLRIQIILHFMAIVAITFLLFSIFGCSISFYNGAPSQSPDFIEDELPSRAITPPRISLPPDARLF